VLSPAERHLRRYSAATEPRPSLRLALGVCVSCSCEWAGDDANDRVNSYGPVGTRDASGALWRCCAADAEIPPRSLTKLRRHLPTLPNPSSLNHAVILLTVPLSDDV
jgi:hypothetical protein